MMQNSNRFEDVERARGITELENVGLCILNVCNAQLPRLPLGIADTAQAQVYRQHANTTESLGEEDRLTSSAAPGDKYFRRAVIRHWRKRRERQPAPQFAIEAQCLLAHWQFHPARIGILFILTPYFFGDPHGDRRQAFDACVQRLLFERFANLLAQDFVNRAGPVCRKKPGRVA